jgi:hypothetical protein
MNEVLKKLLESNILSEESRTELEEAFSKTLNEAVDKAVEEATEATTIKVTTELHEKYVSDRESLIDAIDTKVNQLMDKEVNELKEDIRSYRDLEAESTIEIAKEKQRLAETLKKDMATLVDKLDLFLEARIDAEFETIRGDLQEAKKLNFGRQIIEAFSAEYRKYFVNPTKTEAQLQEANEKIDTLNKKYKNMKKDKDALTRKIKVESVLAPLSGNSRDLMESILSTVPTEKIEESYKTYINRVLKESAPVTKPAKSSKSKPVHESTLPPMSDTFIITGDEPIEESVNNEPTVADKERLALMQLAGITL